LTYKKIIDQFPGHTIYEGDHPGQVYHFFSDTHCCPITGLSREIPGKGALSHRISAFLFSKLTQLNIPNHFLGTRNMRESLMQATHPLPFTLRIHSRANADLSKDFHIPEDIVFDPPLIEYITPSLKYHANDDFLMAMGWVDQDEIDEIHALALRTTHCLQGLLVAWDLSLIEIQLTLARSFEDPFVVAGPLAPENLLLRDLRTGEIWNMNPSAESETSPLVPYILLARRLGVYTQGPSQKSEMGESLDLRSDAQHSGEQKDPQNHGFQNIKNLQNTIMPSDSSEFSSTGFVAPSDHSLSPMPLNAKDLPKNVLIFPNLMPIIQS
jgi:phosphoribosylaminoimidazole-succinocarboxamide synthase